MTHREQMLLAAKVYYSAFHEKYGVYITKVVEEDKLLGYILQNDEYVVQAEKYLDLIPANGFRINASDSSLKTFYYDRPIVFTNDAFKKLFKSVPLWEEYEAISWFGRKKIKTRIADCEVQLQEGVTMTDVLEIFNMLYSKIEMEKKKEEDKLINEFEN